MQAFHRMLKEFSTGRLSHALEIPFTPKPIGEVHRLIFQQVSYDGEQQDSAILRSPRPNTFVRKILASAYQGSEL